MALLNHSPIRPSISYERHRPEETLFYKLIQENLNTFYAHTEGVDGDGLPGFVKREFNKYLKCGILAHGFLRARCESCEHEKIVAFSCKLRGFCPSCGARRMVESAEPHLVDEVLPHRPYRQWVTSFPYQIRFLLAQNPKLISEVLGVIHRVIESHLVKKAGLTKKSGTRTGAVTFVQRFGGSVNLNIHFHQLYLDGVFSFDEAKPKFHMTSPPSGQELESLLHQIAKRVTRLLLLRGLIEKEDNGNENIASTSGVLEHIQSSSITYRIAFGKYKGKKVLSLTSVPEKTSKKEGRNKKKHLARLSGFTLHAGVSVSGGNRAKLERICRYMARPSVSEERLSLNSKGQVVYRLKKAYDNGTSHIALEPVEFLARLASLVPRPRVNLTRFHGVFAPNFKYRSLVVPEQKIEAESPESGGQEEELPIKGVKKRGKGAMSWAQRLKRVFKIDVESCPKCGGKVRIIASIEDSMVITKILDHLGLDSQAPKPLSARGPPQSLPEDSTEYGAGAQPTEGFDTQSFPNYE